MQDKLNMDVVKEFIQQPLPRQILFFDEMLTPRLLQIVYWAALVAVIWEGLGRIFSGSLYGFIEGFVFIALGCLLARVVSELVMLFFQLHENMEQVAKNTASKPTTAAVPVSDGDSKPVRATPTKKVITKKATKKVSKKVTKK
ncbi:MAG TPA: hypothetical protein DCW52_08745 [Gammaproteobacteria bacterium]|nr:hypothetical protein [Gammaproteobacteria bacterium]